MAAEEARKCGMSCPSTLQYIYIRFILPQCSKIISNIYRPLKLIRLTIITARFIAGQSHVACHNRSPADAPSSWLGPWALPDVGLSR